MITTDSLFVFAVVAQVISAQNIPPGFPEPPSIPGLPEKCRRPPPDTENPHECCEVNPMYSPEELQSCGFAMEDFQKPDSAPSDCTKQVCLLEKKGLMDGEKIKYDAVAGYLDQWLQGNDGFKTAADMAKTVCLGQGVPPGPPNICEANRLMFCMGAIMFSNCPDENWQKTDNCARLKAHIDDCRPPFLQ